MFLRLCYASVLHISIALLCKRYNKHRIPVIFFKAGGELQNSYGCVIVCRCYEKPLSFVTMSFDNLWKMTLISFFVAVNNQRYISGSVSFALSSMD